MTLAATIAAVMAGLVAVIAAMARRSAKRAVEVKGLRDAIGSLQTREAIEDDIAEDVDLAGRAMRAGVVRHTEH